ncbi:MAG TPA: pyridoxamine 5'-phosphate oxidase family protein [Bacteroidales bacterium]|nr:pyridoxamine 5'-phosphate oxidase family protein [Bacteroidales bacterium]
MRAKLITLQREIDEIIGKCQVCYVGMASSEGMPYVVPFNFGYKDGVIYLHSAGTGTKIDILKQNPEVCIVFSTDHQLHFQSEQVACSYSMHYRSVQAFGRVEFVEENDQKIEILNIIMANYTDRNFKYNPPSLREVCTYKVAVSRFSGKIFGYVK